mmetsp:Transcript_29497/g.35826  ORF Transcript_29497/g.35826 Transcript_29497/m.35826 type:complete len:352 (+) Transcript_29497:382-1437(+)
MIVPDIYSARIESTPRWKRGTAILNSTIVHCKKTKDSLDDASAIVSHTTTLPLPCPISLPPRVRPLFSKLKSHAYMQRPAMYAYSVTINSNTICNKHKPWHPCYVSNHPLTLEVLFIFSSRAHGQVCVCVCGRFLDGIRFSGVRNLESWWSYERQHDRQHHDSVKPAHSDEGHVLPEEVELEVFKTGEGNWEYSKEGGDCSVGDGGGHVSQSCTSPLRIGALSEHECTSNVRREFNTKTYAHDEVDHDDRIEFHLEEVSESVELHNNQTHHHYIDHESKWMNQQQRHHNSRRYHPSNQHNGSVLLDVQILFVQSVQLPIEWEHRERLRIGDLPCLSNVVHNLGEGVNSFSE